MITGKTESNSTPTKSHDGPKAHTMTRQRSSSPQLNSGTTDNSKSSVLLKNKHSHECMHRYLSKHNHP